MKNRQGILKFKEIRSSIISFSVEKNHIIQKFNKKFNGKWSSYLPQNQWDIFSTWVVGEYPNCLVQLQYI